MPLSALQAQHRQLDFLTAKRACPKGLYLVPASDDPGRWEAVLFVRKGIYAPAILRFDVVFPSTYPRRPPSITFTTDIFHPLVTPLTTYTYSTQDTGADTVSAGDEQRLPPGGFSLSHGFPHWFGQHHASHHAQASIHVDQDRHVNDLDSSPRRLQRTSDRPDPFQAPHIVEVLFYLRTAFTSESLLDTIPIEAAANSGAWHAWQSYRKVNKSASPSISDQPSGKGTSQQQPGGAKKPGEWNWEGVWEDRINRGIKGSLADHAVFGNAATSNDLISFSKLDPGLLDQAKSWNLA